MLAGMISVRSSNLRAVGYNGEILRLRVLRRPAGNVCCPFSLGLLQQFMAGLRTSGRFHETGRGNANPGRGIRPDLTQSNQSRADARARETAKTAL
jgi:hypothetical protein